MLKLDRTYTIWGRVVSGMQFVDAIEKGEPPANPTKIVKASIEADKVPPPAPSSPIPTAAVVRPGVTAPGSIAPQPKAPTPK